ncbi:MAG: hypothetical protein AB1443_09870 [Pseudomonadota bacterium]
MKPLNPAQLSLEFLFDTTVPTAPVPADGGLKVHVALCKVISAALAASPLTREEVGERMSALTGEKITKHMLDAWSAKSREAWRFPLEFVPALEETLETHAVTHWLAEIRGCRVFHGRDALLAELGRAELLRDELAAQIKRIKHQMEGAQ